MYWILTVFPSGSDVNVTVVVDRPVEGAMSSRSIDSYSAEVWLRAAIASGVYSSASSSSRLDTDDCGCPLGMWARKALMRGSRRGSLATFGFAGAAAAGA